MATRSQKDVCVGIDPRKKVFDNNLVNCIFNISTRTIFILSELKDHSKITACLLNTHLFMNEPTMLGLSTTRAHNAVASMNAAFQSTVPPRTSYILTLISIAVRVVISV